MESDRNLPARICETRSFRVYHFSRFHFPRDHKDGQLRSNRIQKGESRQIDAECIASDLLESKLTKGANAIRGSGSIYLTWARHYAALSEGSSDAADDENESGDFDV